MTITKVIKDLIETNTYNEIVSNIGNTQPVTINSIVFANTTFANTSNTSMLTMGGYFKLYGNNYQSGANVYLDRYLASNTQFISSNELRVTFSTIPPKTYSLFLYNPNGSNAIKYNSFLVQGNNTVGYVVAGTFGGSTPTSGGINYSSVEKITFSNDTAVADIRANLPAIRAAASGLNTNQYGYVMAGRANTGYGPGVTAYTNGLRIEFNNDTTAPLNRSDIFGSPFTFGTSTQTSTFGYLAGGIGAPIGFSVSTILRYTFSSDTNQAGFRLNLETGRANFSGSAETSDFGWFFGGYSGSLFSTTVGAPGNTDTYSLVSRMSFSSDTNTTIVRGPVGINSASGSSTQNQSYAWIGGGFSAHSYLNPGTPLPQFIMTAVSSIIRYDFSNDTSAGVTRFPSTTSMSASWGSTTHDNDYGWFMGGTPTGNNGPFPLPAPAPVNLFDTTTNLAASSLVTRLTFANDTSAASSARGNLNQNRRNATGINGINT
jgi:hypothetical protein